MQNINVLILGTTGYVGSVLCRTLDRKSHRVSALVRPHSQVQAIQSFCKRIHRNRTGEFTPNEVEEIIRSDDIQTVISCAWNMPPEQTKEEQFAKDRIALDAALYGARTASSDVHVITTSGNFSLITGEGGTVTETPPPPGTPRPEYMAWADLLSGVNILKDNLTEHYIRQGGNASILYPGSVYGPSPNQRNFWELAGNIGPEMRYIPGWKVFEKMARIFFEGKEVIV
uniref:NAD dependent epimerase/dehydratase family protein n=1 Tax=Candidatus Kentrum sp. TUN TaxID=2126343 RepID=A0A450ZCR3_9GAMM|nr:MAG: NAD dependent epimerase/dehydratase family protein [Candidatus Kentron sp. TUN]